MPSHDNTTANRRWLQTSRTLIVLGCVAGFGALIAGPGYRMGWWDFGPGIKIIVWSGFGASAWLLLSLLFAAMVRRKHGLALTSRFLVGAFICCLTVIPVGFFGAKAKSLPRIHDISTDVENPPKFVAVLPLRKDAKNPVQYDPKDGPLQRAAYPDISSIHLQRPSIDAFRLAEQIAHTMSWDILASDPNALRIEATATTLLFGFTDDIVIRVSSDGANSKVDIRSLSRIGVSDIGANASRIRAFTKRLEALAVSG